MSVIVKGIFEKEMPMPQEGYVDIRLHFKGGRIECATMPIGNPPYYATFKVIELPPHGRLGDLDKLKYDIVVGNQKYLGLNAPCLEDVMPIENVDDCIDAIAFAPTIIEAEGSEE